MNKKPLDFSGVGTQILKHRLGLNSIRYNRHGIKEADIFILIIFGTFALLAIFCSYFNVALTFRESFLVC